MGLYDQSEPSGKTIEHHRHFRGWRSKNARQFEKHRIPLLRGLPEGRRAALVGQLDRAEGRQIPVDEGRLEILPVDHRIGLHEYLEIQIPREKLVRPRHVNPG